MADIREVLASNMKLYRKKLSLSQAKLAEKVNITENYIALIETGKRFPSLVILERISKALKKEPLELFSIEHIELTRKNTLKTEILSDIEAILTHRLSEN